MPKIVPKVLLSRYNFRHKKTQQSEALLLLSSNKPKSGYVILPSSNENFTFKVNLQHKKATKRSGVALLSSNLPKSGYPILLNFPESLLSRESFGHKKRQQSEALLLLSSNLTLFRICNPANTLKGNESK